MIKERLLVEEDISKAECIIEYCKEKAIDLKGRNILIFQNNWEIQWALDKNPSIILSDIGKFQD